MFDQLSEAEKFRTRHYTYEPAYILENIFRHDAFRSFVSPPVLEFGHNTRRTQGCLADSNCTLWHLASWQPGCSRPGDEEHGIEPIGAGGRHCSH